MKAVARNRFLLASWRRQLSGWPAGFAGAVGLCLLIYGVGASLSTPEPGSRWGMGYGIAATVLLLATALYGVRRRAMRLVSRLGLGSARAWLRCHLYGGLLFLLLMLMHSAFRLPSGALTSWLWALSLWTTVSGLIGLLLQRWIPRVLTSGLTIEANYDRIPQLVGEIAKQAAELAQHSPPALQALYGRTVAPVLERPRRRPQFFVDITGGIGIYLRDFEYLRGFFTAEEEEQVNRMEELLRTKFELDAHYTLQHPLRWWLFLHVPTSILLLILVLIHILTVVYY